MKSRVGILLFFFITGICSGVRAQRGESGNQADTVYVGNDKIILIDDHVFVPRRDTFYIIPPHTKYRTKKNPYLTSDAFYKSLQSKTGEKKLTREMYNLLIVSSGQEISDSLRFLHKKEVYKPYKGRRIRKIYYTGVPIFHGDVNDTLRAVVNNFFKTLNKWHVSTHKKVIRSNLLFREGDLVDPDQLADNERILRQLPYIQDARIYVRTDPEDSTAADVFVATQDQFPWGIDPNIKDIDRFDVTLTHSNIAGLGFQAYGGVLVNYRDTIAPVGYKFGYRFDNIAASFVSGMIEFLNAHGRKWLGVRFNKYFLTPQIKWGGGVNVNIHWDDSVHENFKDTVIFYRYSANLQDYWLGRSFLINPAKRRRLILSGRVVLENFINQPFVAPDSNLVFHDKNIILGSFMLLQRDFYKTSLVFSYGVAEDIPHGFLAKITGGYLQDQFFSRPYVGLGAEWAKFSKNVGYFSFIANTGGFIYNSAWKDILLKAMSVYISPLSTFGSYKLRQIGSLYYKLSASDSSSQYIKYGGIIKGLNEYNIWGKSALVATVESSLFTPWFFYGFRFVPFTSLSMGMISKNKNVFVKPDWQGAVTLGLRIFNPSLVFSRIDFSFTYIFNNGNGSSPYRFDFSTNKRYYLPHLTNIERPRMVYE